MVYLLLRVSSYTVTDILHLFVLLDESVLSQLNTKKLNVENRCYLKFLLYYIWNKEMLNILI